MRDVGQLLSIEPPKNFSDLPLRNFNEILVPTTNRIALETGAEEDDPFVQQAQEETADNLSFVDALQTPQDSPPERQNSELSPVPENVPLFQSESNPSSHSGSQASPQTLVSDGPAINASGRFNVDSRTRDQIKGFKSRAGHRFIALDFNDAQNKSARGIEIKIPKDATADEKRKAIAWAKQTQAFLKSKGVKVPIRRGNGIKTDGSGITGVFHTEPFFASNVAARKAIEADPEGYAGVLARTLGAIEGVTFIPPHEQGARGGTTSGKYSERTFASNHLIPALARLAKK